MPKVEEKATSEVQRDVRLVRLLLGRLRFGVSDGLLGRSFRAWEKMADNPARCAGLTYRAHFRAWRMV